MRRLRQTNMKPEKEPCKHCWCSCVSCEASFDTWMDIMKPTNTFLKRMCQTVYTRTHLLSLSLTLSLSRSLFIHLYCIYAYRYSSLPLSLILSLSLSRSLVLSRCLSLLVSPSINRTAKRSQEYSKSPGAFWSAAMNKERWSPVAAWASSTAVAPNWSEP